MMESQDNRTIALSDIIQICSRESEVLVNQQAQAPPVLQPVRCANCNDSGFGGTTTNSTTSHDGHSKNCTHKSGVSFIV